MFTLKFESKLRAGRERVWAWVRTVEGITTEMMPYFRMTMPKGVKTIDDIKITPGRKLFRSYILLFGFIPFDYSDLTMTEVTDGSGFVEESRIASMKKWRHERRIVDCPDEPGAVLLVDQLSFEPKMFPRLVAWFIRKAFAHRHKVLRARLQGED